MHRRRTVLLTVLPVLATHLLLPLALLAALLRSSGGGLVAWLSALLVAAGYFAFIYVAGAWSWFGGVARLTLPALLVVTAWKSYPRGTDRSLQLAAAWPDLVLGIAIGALFAAVTVLALRGRATRLPALDLRIPLRGGRFHVAQGGASRFVNHHYLHPFQRYALDLLKLNAAGIRARGFYPTRLDRYATWGCEVVSPGDGIVAAVVDEFPDRPPPERDPPHPAGNYVAIECGGATVYLAHLMRGSILVRVGEQVRAGQPLGRVGNSGNTSEPHLHVHAEEGSYSGRFSGAPGIPIRFGGRFLVRNDRVATDSTR
jgi:Peptidase family M23